MGLPQIKILFDRLANTMHYRSAKGIVALIVKDDQAKEKSYAFKEVTEIKENTFTEEVIDYIKLAFKGHPNKVIIEVIGATNGRTVDSVLKDLEQKKFNWLSMPKVEEDEKTKLSDWIKAKRKEGKSFKSVIANVAADNEGVVNLTTKGITIKGKVYSSDEYCVRIAGVMAGLSIDHSSTYYVLDEVESITPHEDPNGDIDKGQLILISDGEKVKIARGVTSLVTINKPVTEDLKKIKIVEGMDMIRSDIYTTFSDHYVGKVTNNYDNKVLFFSSISTYFTSLKKSGVLDEEYDTTIGIDIKAQEQYLLKTGVDIEQLTEQQIKRANTGSNVFATGNIKFLDCIEDLNLNLNM